MSHKWKCLDCGRTALAHPSAERGQTQGCISGNCGGTMVIPGPPKVKKKATLPEGPIPGRCPICLDHDCDDPACRRARS